MLKRKTAKWNLSRMIFGICFVAALFALSGGVQAQAKPISVAIITENANATSQSIVISHFAKVAKENGWKVVNANAAGSVKKVSNLMEDEIARGVDAIVLTMVDLRAVQAAVKDANEAHIPVVAIDSGYIPGVVVNITMNNFVAGAQIGSYLVDRLGGEGNVILFYFHSHFGCRRRGEIVDVVLSEYPNIHVLATHELPTTGFVEDAQATMETFLTKFGNKIDAVFTPWDDPSAGVARAITAAGFTRADMFVLGIDGTKQARDMIREGTPFVCTLAQPFESYADTAINIIDEIVVKGRSIDDVTGGVPTIYLPSILITPANVSEK